MTKSKNSPCTIGIPRNSSAIRVLLVVSNDNHHLVFSEDDYVVVVVGAYVA